MNKDTCLEATIQQLIFLSDSVFPEEKDHWATNAQNLLIILLVYLQVLKRKGREPLVNKLKRIRKMEYREIPNILRAVSSLPDVNIHRVKQSLTAISKCGENELHGTFSTMMSFIIGYTALHYE